MLSRRRALLLAVALPLARAARAQVEYPRVAPRPLVFPRDHGAHPEYRIEWWYLTGWLDAAGRDSIGFQVTFFRVSDTDRRDRGSRFAAKQLLIAHAALADPARGALLHDERIQRALAGTGRGVRRGHRRAPRRAGASLREPRRRRYRGTIPARGFKLSSPRARRSRCCCRGRDGFSRKGPAPAQASYYYSPAATRGRGDTAIATASSVATAAAGGWTTNGRARARPEGGRMGLDRHEPRRRRER